MNRFAALCACLSLAILPGCLPGDPTPPSVADGYSSAPIGQTPGGRTKYALVPEACRQAPDRERTEMDASLPPLGCANAYNLQKMAEKKKDLARGRSLGSAPSAPTARAASNYLNGTGEPAASTGRSTAPDNAGAGPAKKPVPEQPQGNVTAAVMQTAQ